MKLLFLLVLSLYWSINLVGQCEKVFAKDKGDGSTQTKASHWKVGKSFDCKLYFEKTKDGDLQVVIGIVEQNEKFRMDASDEVIFYDEKKTPRTYSFFKDAQMALGSNNKSTHVNQLKIKPDDLKWFAESTILGVRFVSMMDMNSNTFRLRASNSKILGRSAICLYENIYPSSKPPLPTTGEETVEDTENKEEVKNTDRDENENTDDLVENKEDSPSPSQYENLDLLLLSPESAANIYAKTLEKELQDISNPTLRDIILNIKIGQLFFEQKRYKAASTFLEKGLERITTANIGKEYKAKAESMLGSIYLNLQNYELAARYNSEALSVWKNGCSTQEDLELAYTAYLNQGKILKNLPESPSCIGYYKLSVSKSQENWQEELKTRNITGIKTQDDSQNITYNLALLSYKNAENLIEQFDKKIQPNKQIETQLELGQLYLEADDLTAAQKHYQNALDLMKDNKSVPSAIIAKTNRTLSEICLKNKSYEEATNYLEQAQLASLGKNIVLDETILQEVDKMPQAIEAVHIITNKGSIAFQKNKEGGTEASLQEVLKDYDIASKILHKVRKTHHGKSENYTLEEATDKLSQQAILVCDRLYEKTQKEAYLEKAFYYAELSKGGLIHDFSQDLESTHDIPREEVIKENGLKMQLVYLKKKLLEERQNTNATNEDNIQQLEEQIAKVSKKHHRLLDEFKKKYPKYHQLKYEDKILEIKDLQKELQADEVFLQYVATDDFIYVLAIGNQSVKSQLKKLSSPLSFTIKKLQYALTHNKGSLYEYNGLKIYQNAIGELASFIENKKLIIAPDAGLYYIPFGVLPVEVSNVQDEEKNRYKMTHFFIQNHAICYNHSAAAFVMSKTQQVASDRAQIATWAPNFTSMNKIIKSKGLGEHLAELPGAQKEANQIADMFGGSQAYIAKAATELQFKELAQSYDVLHIATHGILNSAVPLSSSLVLSNEGQEDGLLNASELYNMNLFANLAVLSACNSGMGSLSKDEGVVGVASAFAYAGVPNVVMSKWAVSDWSTQVLMTAFYKNLQMGMDKDEALQQAKLSYIEDNQGKAKLLAPFFWGSFVIHGNNMPVQALVENSSNYWLYGGGFLALLLVLFLIWRRKQQQPAQN